MCDHTDSFDGLVWEDFALAGALAGELAEAEQEHQRLLKELQPDEEDEDSEL